MQDRFSSGNYTPTGVLAFMKDWQTVLTNPTLQISMESPTGAKEAHDLGYTLRTRYPQLYNEGDDFVVWANNYTRVLQTAKMFVQGFLGFAAAEQGSVVSVTSTGYTGSIGNSLSPSDQCPLFDDDSGGDYATEWADVYIPPIMERLEALIEGNFTFEETDISQMPYLCGFESQITGRLSPWCNVFTDYELQQYEYAQDIRYYWGLGPGTDLEQKMMMPYLNALVGLLQDGPGINGTAANGSSFTLPDLLVTFLNDGQLVELITASGLFDGEVELSGTEMNEDRLFIASHFVTMRGTIAFERLNCIVDGANGQSPNGSTSTSSPSSSGSAVSPSGSSGSNTSSDSPEPTSSYRSEVVKTITTVFSSAVTETTAIPVTYTVTDFSSGGEQGSGAGAGSGSEVVKTFTTVLTPAIGLTTAVPITYTVTQSDSSADQGSGSGSGGVFASSAGSNGESVETITATSLSTYVTSIPVTRTLVVTQTSLPSSGVHRNSSAALVRPTKPASATHPTGAAHNLQRRLVSTTTGGNSTSPRPASGTNATYIRIKLNDAVYTLPSCQSGPGKSCLLGDYAQFISDKYAAEGNWVKNCNVTTAGAPTTVQGASFYTDLTSPWLQELPPY